GDVLLLDLETTGLDSTPLFLIGALTLEEDGLVARQFFARHYGEEPAAIALFLESAAEKRLLVTFNGKSFDVPFLRMRAAVNRVPYAMRPAHLDLLHECRRAWRQGLPNCKLQTLERHVCGRQRHGDIPGSEIPEAYHEFVRTQDAAQMVQVVEHNLLDLVTMAELLVKLPERG
ncbi:MAG: ribonuclease H-like domain-containing protein, partial [Planctomycetota bacterium]|nr:ribonuclease H-like domain-containing protein [Planctomycetota bacterium]